MKHSQKLFKNRVKFGIHEAEHTHIEGDWDEFMKREQKLSESWKWQQCGKNNKLLPLACTCHTNLVGSLN